MKVLWRVVPLAAALFLGSGGCKRGSDIKSGVSQLKHAFPAATAAASAVPDNSTENSNKQVNVDACVAQAISSLQRNDYVGAVTFLTTVRKQPNLTAEQHMAVHETIEKTYSYLVNRATQGDAQAKAAIADLQNKPSQ